MVKKPDVVQSSQSATVKADDTRTRPADTLWPNGLNVVVDDVDAHLESKSSSSTNGSSSSSSSSGSFSSSQACANGSHGSLERLVQGRKRSVIDELKRNFLLLNEMQVKRSSSVQINNNLDNSEPGFDAYRKYIRSVQSLERQRSNGITTKFGGFIGILMKTKSANRDLNKLNGTVAEKIEENGGGGTRGFQSSSESSLSVPTSLESSRRNDDSVGEEEPVFERPTTRQFERERRQAVREQTVRTKTLKQWNLADFTHGKSDYLEPRQRLESLRSLTNTPSSTTTSVNNPSCRNTPVSRETSFTKEFLNNSNEIYRHKPPSTTSINADIGPFGSLNNCDYYPSDYRYPRKSMDGGSNNNNNNHNNNNNNLAPWFDVHKIKEAVSHESIANISQTRFRWQQMVDECQTNQTSRSTTPNVLQKQIVVRTNRSTPVVGGGGSGMVSRHAYSSQSLNSGTTVVETNNNDDLSKCLDFNNMNLDCYERERLMFIAYIHGHPEVVASLGIVIPSHIKDKFPLVARMKVELKEVPQHSVNGYHSNSPGENGYHRYSTQYIKNSSPSTDPSSMISPPSVNGHGGSKNGRYIKNAQQPMAVSSTQRKIVRKQSSAENNANPPLNDFDSSAVPKKSWKLAEWVEPPPAINRNSNEPSANHEHTNGNDGEHYQSSYRSTGESLIAREIRELREREEELRRSRSELGLANIDDIMDSWKRGDDQPQNGLRSARSLDYLHVLVENGLQQTNNAEYPNKLQTRSGSMDHLHYAANNDHRSYEVQNIAQSRPSVKSIYEKFLTSHSENKSSNGGGFNQNYDTPAEPPGTTFKRRYTTIEARIEQELQELQKREDELRRQREAAGLYPPTTNGHHAGSVNSSEESAEDYLPKPTNGQHYENGFKPQYEFHKMDDPDEMMFAPTGDESSRTRVDGTVWLNVGDSRVKL